MSEKVLEALSAVGTMSMDTFNACFQTLSNCSSPNYDSFDIKDIRYRTLRIISSLGHCETDFDRRYISVCPPSLVSLPHAGLPRAVLTGARTHSTVQRLQRFETQNREEISIEIIDQVLFTNFSTGSDSPTFPLPTAVITEAISHAVLEKLVGDLRLGNYLPNSPVSYLTEFSSGVNELKKSLIFKHVAEPNWSSWIFRYDQLKFERGRKIGKDTTLSSYIRPIDQQRLHIYWVEGIGAQIDRDWGRWLLLSDYKINAILYDKRQQAMAIPATVPLPGLLARAAVFCSGRAPSSIVIEGKQTRGIPLGHPMDVYRSVPPSIAQAIAIKLDQSLQDHRLELLN